MTKNGKDSSFAVVMIVVVSYFHSLPKNAITVEAERDQQSGKGSGAVAKRQQRRSGNGNKDKKHINIDEKKKNGYDTMEAI